MIVRKYIDFNEPLTEEQHIRLRALRNRPVFIDDDCPSITPEQVAEFKRNNPDHVYPPRPADDYSPRVIYLNKSE